MLQPRYEGLALAYCCRHTALLYEYTGLQVSRTEVMWKS